MRYTNVLNWLSKPRNLWLFVFIYTIVAGLFVQLILLPYAFPSWHAGNGLLKGVDGPKFHRIAFELSEKISAGGWGQWELMPRGQLVSGVAAICYVLVYPAPWSVLPVNAFLNASACVCLYLILASLVGNRQKGFVASLPFIFFPVNLLWNTQFHNENYAVSGVLFILYGWMLITRTDDTNDHISLIVSIKAILLILLGSFLLGLVRVYILSGISYIVVVIGIVLGIDWSFERNKVKYYFMKLFLVSLACVVMLFVVSVIESLDMPSVESSALPEDTAKDLKIPTKWSRTTWIPDVMDDKLQELSKYRMEFVREWAHGGSSIDLDVTFENVWDMVTYIPRAFQIAFFAPFPNVWFSEGQKASGTAMRIVSAFEMMVVYFCLLGLPLFLWEKRKQPAVWVVFFICTSILIVYAMIVPNVGALYRFRYPYFMPLISFGLAGWIIIGTDMIALGKRIP